MYTRVIYNLALNESGFEQDKMVQFESIFDKVEIYSKNLRYINEGHSKLPSDVYFNLNEREQLNDMFSYIELKLMENYLEEGSWNDFIGWAKNKGNDIKNSAIELGDKVATNVKNVVADISKLPAKIKAGVEFIEKILKSGITKVSDFVKYIGQLLAKLGATVKEAVLSLGGFKDSDANGAPKLPEKFNPLTEKDKTSNAVFNYVMQFVFDKCKDKSYKIALNEDEAKYSDSMSAVDKFFLSKKDSWLEKSKNNTLFRLFLSGTNASGERLGFFKVLIISIVGSFIVCTLVPLIASSVFGLTGTGLTILVFSCKGLWVLKNVARIIINRTLTYKQSFKIDKNNEKIKHSRLFDIRTILSLCIAVITPALFHIYHDEITGWFHSLFHDQAPDPEPLVEETDPEVIEEHIIPRPDDGLHPEPTPEPEIPTPEPEVPVPPTPDPVPEVENLISENIEPVPVTPEEPTIEISENDSPIIAIKLEDAEQVVPTQIDNSNAEDVVNQLNTAVGNEIQGDLNQYTLNNSTINVNNVTNVYNAASSATGGSMSGMVVLHDHGHPVQFANAVHSHGCHVVAHHDHHYVVNTHHHHEPHRYSSFGHSHVRELNHGNGLHGHGHGNPRLHMNHGGGHGGHGGGPHGGGHGRH